MKVTAILPDRLLKEVQKFAKGKNLTECLVMALEEWSNLRHIKELNKKIEKTPLQFSPDLKADGIRETNRKS
ncbi:MAG: DUF2191 domain-containing protein [bacterium]